VFATKQQIVQKNQTERLIKNDIVIDVVPGYKWMMDI
jgi:hypothetical protein